MRLEEKLDHRGLVFLFGGLPRRHVKRAMVGRVVIIDELRQIPEIIVALLLLQQKKDGAFKAGNAPFNEITMGADGRVRVCNAFFSHKLAECTSELSSSVRRNGNVPRPHARVFLFTQKLSEAESNALRLLVAERVDG